MDMKAKFNKGGNMKLGKMWTWSTLYGDFDHYIPKLGYSVVGTCSGHCDGCKHKCYVAKSYRYPSVKFSHARNTLAMRSDINGCYADLFNQINRARKKPDIIRLNQSGEIENLQQFEMFCALAADFPEIDFYIYTKNYGVVIPSLLGGLVPANLTVLISVWHEYGIKEFEQVKHLKNVKAFVYDDGYNYNFKIDTYCNAYDVNGKLDKNITCQKCRKCFNRLNSCKIIGCKAH